MSDGDALLKAILKNPACDTARLVYADWLQENGEGDRAEFIRLQVGLSKVDETVLQLASMMLEKEVERGRPLFTAEPGTPLWNRRRERELLYGPHASGLCRNHTAWAGRAASFVLPQNAEVAYRFERGFIVTVFCRGARWLQYGDEILTQHPVKKVMITSWASHPEILEDRYLEDRWPGITFDVSFSPASPG